jgi:hypothetical protein
VVNLILVAGDRTGDFEVTDRTALAFVEIECRQNCLREPVTPDGDDKLAVA